MHYLQKVKKMMIKTLWGQKVSPSESITFEKDFFSGVEIFRQSGLISSEGEFTERGKRAFGGLLSLVPSYQDGLDSRELGWGPFFIPYMSHMVHVAVELVALDKDKARVLLLYRDDPFFKGYHTPGSYMASGESYESVATRVADKELGCQIKFLYTLPGVIHQDGARFNYESVLTVCQIVGDVPERNQNARWFSYGDLQAFHQDIKSSPIISEQNKFIEPIMNIISDSVRS